MNDAHMIEYAKTTTIPEVEVMYWIVEDSLFDGNKEKARGIMDFLLYIAKYNKPALEQGLKKQHRDRLKQLCFELNDVNYHQEQKAININCPISSRKLPFEKECQLRDYLYEHKDILSVFLNERIKMYGKEIKVSDNYKCDLVVESGDTLFAIELKIVQANHQVCSQIDKYCFYFYRSMRYDRFKKIQGVVIASGFDEWSVNELRRRKHIIGEIIPEAENSISLRKID